MDTNRFIYAGTPDRGYGPWIFIEDTPESRLQALDEGYTAFSTSSFAYEPEKGKPEPVRYGDLWLDIDCKEAPFLAVIAARTFITDLASAYVGFDPAILDYFMSGSKGVHIRIPPEIFGGENGHPFLPRLHRKMLERHFLHHPHNHALGLLALGESVPAKLKDKTVGDLVDESLYAWARGICCVLPMSGGLTGATRCRSA